MARMLYSPLAGSVYPMLPRPGRPSRRNLAGGIPVPTVAPVTPVVLPPLQQQTNPNGYGNSGQNPAIPLPPLPIPRGPGGQPMPAPFQIPPGLPVTYT